MKLIDTLSRIFNRNSILELKDLTTAIDRPIEILAEDVKKLDREYIINQSTGEWADEWGSWFGINRLVGESDETYGNRIVAIVANPKSTIPALRESTRAYLGDPNAEVDIYEPHTNIKIFNKSTFSGVDRFQDGTYYRSGVIDISIADDITPLLRETLHQIKSGGVKIYYTRVHNLGNPVISSPDVPPIIFLERHLELSSKMTQMEIQVLSQSGSRSGRRIIWNEQTRELELYVPSTQEDRTDSIPVEISSYKYSGRSVGMFRSTITGGFSGPLLTPYDLKNPLPWEPKPLKFMTNELIELKPTESPIFFTQRETEIESHSMHQMSVITDRVKEIEIVSLGYRQLTAISELELSKIWDKTLEEVNLMVDDSLGSVQVEKLPI